MRLCMALLCVLALSATSIAQKSEKPPRTITTTAYSSAEPTTRLNRALSTVGFEASEGFSTGFVDDQAGWSTFSNNVVSPVISAGNPNTGAQHLRLELEPALGQSDLVGAFSPLISISDPTTPTTLSFDAFISELGGADYRVVGQAPTQSLLTVDMTFDFQGDINILVGSSNVEVGTYNPGEWMHWDVTVDPAAETIEYFLNGNLFFTDDGGLVNGTVFEQVVILSDNWNTTDVGDFDNVSWGFAEGEDCDITGLSLSGNMLTITGTCESGVDIYGETPDGEIVLVAEDVVVNDSITIEVNVPDALFFAVPANAATPASSGDGLDGAVSERAVPTLGEWGLIAFTLLLLAVGVFFMRKNRNALA